MKELEHAATHAIANILLAEIRNETVVLWNDLFDFFVVGIIDETSFATLTKVQRFGVGVVVICAQKYSYYPFAFDIMCEWEALGGAYWIVQVEITRHAMLHIVQRAFDNGFNPSKKQFRQFVGCEIDRIFPNFLLPLITNETLIKQLLSLRSEVLDFVSSLSSIDLNNDSDNHSNDQSAEAAFAALCEGTPFASFMSWFHTWSQNILVGLLPNELQAPSCRVQAALSSLPKSHACNNINTFAATSTSTSTSTEAPVVVGVVVVGSMNSLLANNSIATSAASKPHSSIVSESSSTTTSTATAFYADKNSNDGAATAAGHHVNVADSESESGLFVSDSDSDSGMDMDNISHVVLLNNSNNDNDESSSPTPLFDSLGACVWEYFERLNDNKQFSSQDM